VVEELRYLDSAVLIAFLRARSDFGGREPDHYTVQLRYCSLFVRVATVVQLFLVF